MLVWYNPSVSSWVFLLSVRLTSLDFQYVLDQNGNLFYKFIAYAYSPLFFEHPRNPACPRSDQFLQHRSGMCHEFGSRINS